MSVAEEVPMFPPSGSHGREEYSLLGNEKDHLYSKETLYSNFYSMSIAFSVNHGCAVTCLAFASTELGNSMGSVTSGILYVGYAITAFLLARPIVTALGKVTTTVSSYSYFPNSQVRNIDDVHLWGMFLVHSISIEYSTFADG